MRKGEKGKKSKREHVKKRGRKSKEDQGKDNDSKIRRRLVPRIKGGRKKMGLWQENKGMVRGSKRRRRRQEERGKEKGKKVKMMK